MPESSNILLIMTDQQRVDTLGVAGNSIIKPHVPYDCPSHLIDFYGKRSWWWNMTGQDWSVLMGKMMGKKVLGNE